MDWNKIKNCNCGDPDTALLLMRLVLALVFISHGWMKSQNISGTVKFFAGLGLPEFLVYVVTFVELAGGLAMLFGIFTHWAGKLLAFNMLGAVVFATWPKGGLLGSEFELALLALALGVAMIGPGRYTFAWLTKGK